MGLMSSQLQSDAVWLMADGDSLPGSESVTYKPKGGTARTINAQVFRYARQDDGSGKRHRMELVVANDATYGISSSEINFEGDRLSIDYDQTGTAKDYVIRRPEEGEVQDPGMLLLILE